MFSTEVPKKSTGEWICRRLMAWFREIGLEFVDIVMSDNEPALASFIESWSHLRAMKGGLRNSPVGSSKRNGTVERAVQSAQRVVRTLRSSLEDNGKSSSRLYTPPGRGLQNTQCSC